MSSMQSRCELIGPLLGSLLWLILLSGLLIARNGGKTSELMILCKTSITKRSLGSSSIIPNTTIRQIKSVIQIDVLAFLQS